MTTVKSAPIYGNYHSYYIKRTAHDGDPRLALLPPGLLSSAVVLDFGCNKGWVTCEVAQAYGASTVVGVDIDATLVRGAWRRRRVVWSLCFPEDGGKLDLHGSASPRGVGKICPPKSTYYFPASCEHMFGPLPILPSESDTKSRFPHNVRFRVADWVIETIPEDKDGYDVVLALSVTKWVHLNGGDDGLKQFFKRVHDVLRPGGVLVLEPQSWESYNNAKHMDEACIRLTENAKRLQLRPDDFGSVLESVGFNSDPQHLGFTGKGGFHRPVYLYVRS
ncbi:Bin3-domain-containing protein [Fistulina hepatica ATCC 64428]|uniref:RNA methyltransferase n=1 Tax=Fistulina hepatica ATCC 64428 TaxID=1128425 RepID=A0A0D7A2R6_9AGAR|nr:Bin3-domain-containing protein [Fistulina hepatica ATCC 64428]